MTRAKKTSLKAATSATSAGRPAGSSLSNKASGPKVAGRTRKGASPGKVPPPGASDAKPVLTPRTVSLTAEQDELLESLCVRDGIPASEVLLEFVQEGLQRRSTPMTGRQNIQHILEMFKRYKCPSLELQVKRLQYQ